MLDLLTLTLKLDLLFKNFNVGHIFWMVSDRTFIIHICVPYDKTFLLVPKIFTFWSWSLSYFLKLNIVHIYWMVSDMDFIFPMHVLYRTIYFNILTLILSFDDDGCLSNLPTTQGGICVSQHILFYYMYNQQYNIFSLGSCHWLGIEWSEWPASPSWEIWQCWISPTTVSWL
jgi:hypothetical protein